MARWLPSALLLLAWAAACGPAPSPTSSATPVPQVTVGVSALPRARSLGLDYLEQHPALPFDLVPMASESGLQAAEDGLGLFHLDYPPAPEGWFATPLGWEGIAIVVHPGIPTRSLTLKDLARIFSGQIRDWGQLTGGQGPIQPVVPPPGDRFRQAFLDQVMPAERVSSRALIAPTPEAAIELVSTTEGAIGLLQLSYDRPSTLPLARVEGSLPGPSTLADGSYPLRVQLLALAPGEPEGGAREWLSWVQSRGEN